jgi:hypothetical protein
MLKVDKYSEINYLPTRSFTSLENRHADDSGMVENTFPAQHWISPQCVLLSK